MGKTIIITSGPTNEQIDAVMKITNMSTGTLGAVIADAFINSTNDGDIDKIYYISPKLARKPRSSTNKIECLTVESTQDLLDTLTNLLTSQHIDLVVHSAAVGDYKAAYTIRAEDLIDEIWGAIQSGRVSGKNGLMAIFENPRAVQNDDTKISSYEPHLMTMMALTPKVIGSIKKISPDTKLVGFKLLEGVSREELFEVADRLRVKNQADFIVANDLSKIGGGKHWAMIVGPDGVAAECNTKDEIAETIIRLTM